MPWTRPGAGRAHWPTVPVLRGLVGWARIAVGIGLLWGGGLVILPPVANAAPPIQFARDILPILSDNCFHCHGPDASRREADLRLDTEEGALVERDGYRILVRGHSDQSELFRRITSDDDAERMPPVDSKRSLTGAQVELLRRWIDEGAAWGRHWAFETPVRPPLPEVRNPAWVRDPLDRFILARLEAEGLSPAPEANRETLLRRVTLDLTGLPPTLAELDAFLADPRPDAYERAVDRLLASPRYGERMAWDWLDAARYADSNGYQGDPDRTMWPWRDLVVRAFNANQPFDQFTIEQLAGDLLPGATLEQRIATGFNRNHMFNGEGGRIAEETRVENVMDRAETTATVWLGVTMGCARCHDHKYDPFTNREYYQLYAFFNQTSETGGASGGGRSGQIPPVVDVASAEDNARLEAAQRQLSAAAAEVEALEAERFPRAPGQTAADSPAAAEFSGNVVAALAQAPARRSTDALREMIFQFESRDPPYAASLKRLKAAVEARERAAERVPRVMVMDELPQPRATFMLLKGAYDKPGEPVVAGVPASLAPPLQEAAGPGQPVNRLALARWLVDRRNPLTARVTVNRHWQMIFGTGLVKTVEDFGVQGERPSHPELLDYLAVELVDSGWDLKRLLRRLVTSATYRQSARVTPALVERDPENRLLARGARFRLPAWMIRDQALAASGLLVDRPGGPPVRPYQPEGLWEEATFGKKSYEQDHGESLYRRSLYTFWRRIIGPPVFFDNAARQVCTLKQVRTNTPLHALTTLNDVTFVEAARALAERAIRDGGSTSEGRLALAFRRATCRPPTAAEAAILREAYARQRELMAADPQAAARLLAVGESPRDPAIDPAEHAALTQVCLLILNLDEVLTKE